MSWYTVPFSVGSRYSVKKATAFLGHDFNVGDIVEFTTHSYDAKQGLIRFWFKDTTSGRDIAWHVWDNGPPADSSWSEYFDRLE